MPMAWTRQSSLDAQRPLTGEFCGDADRQLLPIQAFGETAGAPIAVVG
jgi:hypothetical protein